MVRTYKKKSEGGRTNYAMSEVMVAAYNSVIKKEMSANQASIHYRVNKKSLQLHRLPPNPAQLYQASLLKPHPASFLQPKQAFSYSMEFTNHFI